LSAGKILASDDTTTKLRLRDHAAVEEQGHHAPVRHRARRQLLAGGSRLGDGYGDPIVVGSRRFGPDYRRGDLHRSDTSRDDCPRNRLPIEENLPEHQRVG
jgi:hypothetical protein